MTKSQATITIHGQGPWSITAWTTEGPVQVASGSNPVELTQALQAYAEHTECFTVYGCDVDPIAFVFEETRK